MERDGATSAPLLDPALLGVIVADLIEREAGATPLEEPHVNLGGVEEVVADKDTTVAQCYKR